MYWHGWQLMDTAPRDGGGILVVVQSSYGAQFFDIVEWTEDGWFNGDDIVTNATHWTHLPGMPEPLTLPPTAAQSPPPPPASTHSAE